MDLWQLFLRGTCDNHIILCSKLLAIFNKIMTKAMFIKWIITDGEITFLLAC